MVHDISGDRRADTGPKPPAEGDPLAREQAVRQIERRRRFWARATIGTLLMIVVTASWAFAEYHNAGGWPTRGWSQSSGIPNVWNDWIIWPAMVWVLWIAGDAWRTFSRKPISEAEIQREIDRQAGERR